MIGHAVKRALIAVVIGVALSCCGSRGPQVSRLSTRPGTPTVAIEPGEHRLGLGGPLTRRDGTLYVPHNAGMQIPLPLLVLLHGGGGREDYFRFTFPMADDFGVVILTLDSRDNTWDGIDSPFGPDVVFIDDALRYTFERVAVDPRRVALGGVSDGAFYALSLGLVNGDLFTHLVAVAPGFFKPPGPPVGRPRIFVAHGTRDNVYDVRGSRNRVVPQLRRAGYDVTYREFDGPHSMVPETTRQVLEWLVNMSPRRND
jgi:phospholipase/carboxylesterase